MLSDFWTTGALWALYKKPINNKAKFTLITVSCFIKYVDVVRVLSNILTGCILCYKRNMHVPGSFLKVTCSDLLLSACPSILPIWFIALASTLSLSISRDKLSHDQLNKLPLKWTNKLMVTITEGRHSCSVLSFTFKVKSKCHHCYAPQGMLWF